MIIGIANDRLLLCLVLFPLGKYIQHQWKSRDDAHRQQGPTDGPSLVGF